MSNTKTGVKTVTKDKVKQKFEVKPPKHYKIILHNNNRTSFEAVVDVLRTIFNKNTQQAYQMMMTAHESGIALVEAPVSKEMGDAKVKQARDYCVRRENEADRDFGGGNGHNYLLLQFEVQED